MKCTQSVFCKANVLFWLTYKQGNLVLGNVHEELAKAEPRRMGVVLVPLSQQQNVELQVRHWLQCVSSQEACLEA